MDDCIEILKLSRDGEALASQDLSLVEAVVNGGKDRLTELGQQRWEALLRQLRGGQYQRPWLYGIEHLTQDVQGYVYWKSVQIEHYSHRDPDAGRRDATQLAEICSYLERQKIPVSASGVSKVYDQLFWGVGPGLDYEKVIAFYALDRQGARISFMSYQTDEEVKDLIRDNLRGLAVEWGSNLNSVSHTRIAEQDHWQMLSKNLQGSWNWAVDVLHIDPYHVEPKFLNRAQTFKAIEDEQARWKLPQSIAIRKNGYEPIF